WRHWTWHEKDPQVEAQGSRLRSPKCHRKSTQRSTREHLGGEAIDQNLVSGQVSHSYLQAGRLISICAPISNSGHQFTADDRDLKDDGRGSNPVLGQVIASRANNARGNRRSDWGRNLCFAHRHAIQNRGPSLYYLPEILCRNKGNSSLLWASGDHIKTCDRSRSGRRL